MCSCLGYSQIYRIQKNQCTVLMPRIQCSWIGYKIQCTVMEYGCVTMYNMMLYSLPMAFDTMLRRKIHATTRQRCSFMSRLHLHMQWIFVHTTCTMSFYIVLLLQPLLCALTEERKAHARGKKKFGPDERMTFTEERNGWRRQRKTSQVLLWVWTMTICSCK